ncbi:TorF family putative porin [Ramlibacter sp. AN1015]|uniref:TorF family putative porin n=1 Tax=Ramlibacter sp. AN1015 TaxID=3133428 RepID=UPI0030C05085
MSKKAGALLTLLVATGAAQAQATAQPAPPYELSYNVGLVSDYRYRGISQTAKRPALQGGVDLAHASGLYAGLWASTIRWIEDSGADLRGPVEVDLYGGFKGSLSEGVGYDVGGLYYWYPNNDLKNLTGENANTFELYGALSAGPATLKYSHALTTLFGAPDSENSGYLDLSASFDIGNGFSVVPHVGWQRIRNFGTYRDYAITLAKDFGEGFTGTAAVVGTNWDDRFGASYTLPGSGSRDLAKSGVVVGLKKTF